MAIGSPPSDPNPPDFLLRSGARSGHKREFAFALRSQSDASLSRTRSGKSPSASPLPLLTSRKRPKRTPSAGDQIAGASPNPTTPHPPLSESTAEERNGDEIGERPARSESKDSLQSPKAEASPAKGSVVGDGDERGLKGNVDESVAGCAEAEISAVMGVDGMGEGIAAEISVGVGNRDAAGVEMGSPERPVKRITRSASKASLQSPKIEASPAKGSAVGDDDERGLKVSGEGVAAELKGNVGKSAVGMLVVDGGSDGDVVQTPTSVAGHGDSKKCVPLDKPAKRFTRSALKTACKDTVASQGDLSVCDVKGPDVDRGVPEKLDKVVSVICVKTEKPDQMTHVDVGALKKPDKVPDSSACEKTARRFTRSALKAPVTVQEATTADALVTVEDRDACKVGNNVTEKRIRKLTITRSAVKPQVEDPPAVETTKTSAVLGERKRADNASDGTPRATTKNKMELKMSKKIALTKLPSNVRDLFATGLLEGYRVKYICTGKQIDIEGVIKGNTILCCCASCKGSKAFSAYNFEVHAGSNKKHPSDYIFLANGNSLRDVLKACTSAPLNMVETVIQNAIGEIPSKRPSSCRKCGETFHTSHTGDFEPLCDLCLNVKQPQKNATPSRGNSSNAKLSRTTLGPDSSDFATKSASSHKKNTAGKLTRKDLGLHKLVFMGNILLEGTEVAYYHSGQRLLDGYIKDSGIFCYCCNAVVSPSLFEAHAGRASRKKPYNNIYTSNGVSLHELAVSLSKDRKMPTSANDDLCSICADGGKLLLCDLCPRAFHKECLGLPKLPDGDWCCQFCESMHQREKFVESNDNAIAAGRVPGVDPIEQIIKRCIRVVTSPGTCVGGCVLCRLHDFSKATFDERTVMICDQCEKEYHVGCLRDHNMCDLKELPEEEWFCGTDCSRIHAALQELLLRGPEPLQGVDADIIRKKRDEKGLSMDDVDIRWRLLSGKTASAESELLLSKAVSLLRESFDPIVEAATGRDLIPVIVNGENMRDQDFGGMYCAVLTVNSSIVSVGTLRILGRELAELPLVATSRESQGQGYFQSLFSCIERLLESLKVKHFVLPAADEALSIWTKKFGFTKIASDQLIEFAKGARAMIFQGTSMLHKPVPVAQDFSQGNEQS